MLFVYGAKNCNGQFVLSLYKKRFPHKFSPHITTFSSVNKKLHETGCLVTVKMNRERTTKTPYNDEHVLNIIESHPSINTRTIRQQVGFSHMIVRTNYQKTNWRVIQFAKGAKIIS